MGASLSEYSAVWKYVEKDVACETMHASLACGTLHKQQPRGRHDVGWQAYTIILDTADAFTDTVQYRENCARIGVSCYVRMRWGLWGAVMYA